MKDPVKYKRFLFLYYAYKFLCDFGLIYPVYLLYFQQQGLSLVDISFLMAFWAACAFFLEIPSGALADRWSRRGVLIIGMFFKAAAFLTWYFAGSVYLFALGFLLWAVQETFSSGALEALLYDNMKYYGAVKDYDRITGRAHMVHKVAIAIAMLAGSIMASRGYQLPLLITAGTFLLGVLPPVLITEHRDESARHKKYLKILKKALKQSWRSRELLQMMLYGATVFAVYFEVEEFVQLYLEWVRFPVQAFGIFFVVLWLAQALGNAFAFKLKKLPGFKYSLYYLGLLSGIFLALSVFGRLRFMSVFLILSFIFCAAGHIIGETRLQDNCSSDIRATVISVFSMIFCLSAVLLSLIFGLVVHYLPLEYAYVVFGGIMVVSSILLFFREKTIKK